MSGKNNPIPDYRKYSLISILPFFYSFGDAKKYRFCFTVDAMFSYSNISSHPVKSEIAGVERGLIILFLLFFK
jgi:hypothetical protein